MSEDSLTAARIKQLRGGKSVRQFASDVGVTRSNVDAWEKGNSKPSADTLIRLAELYGVTTDWLLGRPENGATTLGSEFPNLPASPSPDAEEASTGKFYQLPTSPSPADAASSSPDPMAPATQADIARIEAKLERLLQLVEGPKRPRSRRDATARRSAAAEYSQGVNDVDRDIPDDPPHDHAVGDET